MFSLCALFLIDRQKSLKCGLAQQAKSFSKEKIVKKKKRGGVNRDRIQYYPCSPKDTRKSYDNVHLFQGIISFEHFYVLISGSFSCHNLELQSRFCG